MKELKNVKDVLKDVLFYKETLDRKYIKDKSDPECRLMVLIVSADGLVQISIYGMGILPVSDFGIYFFMLMQRIGSWASEIAFELRVRFDTFSLRPDLDTNFFRFKAKDVSPIPFKDPTVRGESFTEDYVLYPIDSLLLD